MTSSHRIFPPNNFRNGGMPRQDPNERELELMRRELEAIRDEPLLTASVVEIRGDAGRMLVSLGPGNAIDINMINGVRVGSRVRCHRNSMQAIDVLPDQDAPTGMIVTVQGQTGNLVEAEIMGALRAFRSTFAVVKGERVILDPSMTFVIGTLGMPPQAFSFSSKVSVEWGDVGGHVEAKSALREAIELPYSHPALFRAYGKRPVKGVLLHGPSGCIAGDMHVPYSIRDKDGKRQNHKGGSIEHLYRRFNGISTPGKGYAQRPQTIESKFFVPCMNEDGRIFRSEIDAVIDSGIKLCVRVRTTIGREIVCTPDHPFATDVGFLPVASLGVGAKVLTHQNVKWTAGDEEKRRVYRPEVLVKNHPHMRSKIVRNSSGEYEYKRLTRARAVFEANLNGIGLDSYVKRLNDGILDGLVFSDPSDDIHHLDENPTNDTADNLIALSHADHAGEHMDERIEFMRSHVAIEEEIESIEDVGERRTYDIRMKACPRNFVTAGFVVHNTGKTLLAKAAATSIARAHGSKHADGFAYVKGPELLNAFIGRTEEAIRRLFSAARTHHATHGYPAVIFLDECDALLGSRDRNTTTSITTTTVPQFLAEMDGLEDSGAMLILATNRPDMLDSAVVRDGRVDRRVRVGRPARQDAGEIFAIHLRGRPVHGTTLAELAELGAGMLYEDERVLRELEPEIADGTGAKLRLRDFASGAMISAVIERSSSAALQRDIAANASATGITPDDLRWSISQAQLELANVSHGEAISEMIEAGILPHLKRHTH